MAETDGAVVETVPEASSSNLTSVWNLRATNWGEGSLAMNDLTLFSIP